MDGTLYSTGAPIEGAPEVLRRLQRNGVPYRLVTNTTSRSRSGLVDRLKGYGFEVSPEDIFSATLAGARLARAAGHRAVAPFLPEPAMEDLKDLDLVGGTSGKAPAQAPQAVIIGDLGDRWDYHLVQEAFEYLMAGAELIALSRDKYWLKDGRLALDAGPFVAGLEFATGKSALVAGKPSPAFYQAAVESLGTRSGSSVAMIGDDLWSDVDGAQRAGLEGWLVRTGKFRESVLRESGIKPDRILESIADLG